MGRGQACGKSPEGGYYVHAGRAEREDWLGGVGRRAEWWTGRQSNGERFFLQNPAEV